MSLLVANSRRLVRRVGELHWSGLRRTLTQWSFVQETQSAHTTHSARHIARRTTLSTFAYAFAHTSPHIPSTWAQQTATFSTSGRQQVELNLWLVKLAGAQNSALGAAI